MRRVKGPFLAVLAAVGLVVGGAPAVSAAPGGPTNTPAVATATDDGGPAPITPSLAPGSRPRGEGPNPFAYLPATKKASHSVDPQTLLGTGSQPGRHAQATPAPVPMPSPAPAAEVPGIQASATNAPSVPSTADAVGAGLTRNGGSGSVPQIAAAYTISGKVTNSHSAAIPGVLVYAEGQTPTSGWYNTTTAADGTYTLNVDPGSYLMVFMDTGTYAGGYYSSTGWQKNQQDATLVAVTTTNVGNINVTMPAYGRITGRVTNGAAAGIAGMYATAYIGTTVQWNAVTASDGSYSLRMTPGSYTIKFNDPHFSYMPGWYSGAGFTADSSSASAVIINDGSDTTGIDVVEPPNHSIKGVVTTAGTGTPIANAWVTASGPAWVSVQTGADGSYQIQIDPGTYTVCGFDSTYVYAQGCTSGVTLGSTGDVTANLSLNPYVFIRGTVKTKTGVAISGATVAAIGESYPGSSMTTAVDGTYAVKVAPTSSHALAVSADLYVSGYYYNGSVVTDQGSASSVTVGTSDLTGVDIAMPARPVLAGRIVDVHGSGAAGVSVQASSDPYGYYGMGQTSTDANGHYSLVIPVNTTVYLSFADSNLTYIGGCYDGVSSVSQACNGPAFTKAADTITQLNNVVLHKYGVIAGTVKTKTGTPVTNIYVQADPYHSQYNLEDGSFRFRFDASASVGLSFTDYSDIYVSGSYPATGTVVGTGPARTFSVTLDSEVDLNVVMLQYVTLSGTLKDTHGSPIVGNAGLGAFAGGSLAQQGWVGTNGSFSLKVVPGVYELALYAVNPAANQYEVVGWYSTSGMVYASGVATPIDLTQGNVTVNPVLETIAIKGTLSWAAGRGILGAEVDIIKNGSLYAYGTTDSNGNYWIRVAPGTYTVGISGHSVGYSDGWYGSSGYTPDPSSAKAVTVTSSDITVNVTIPVELTISGTVMTPGGAGRAYAFVEAFANGRFYSSTQADGSGHYSIRVPPSNVTLWFWDVYGSYAGGWYVSGAVSPYYAGATVFAMTASRTGINVKLAAALSITGTVQYQIAVGATGTIPDMLVEADNAGYAVSYAFTDGYGRFTMIVPAGSYIVWSDDSGRGEPYAGTNAGGWFGASGFTSNASQAKVVSGAAGSSVSVGTITLPLARHITGAVTDTYGNGVPLVEAEVFLNGMFYEYVRTQSDGSYSLPVPPGTYRIGYWDLRDVYAAGWYAGGQLKEFYSQSSAVAVANADVPLSTTALPLQTRPGAPSGATATPYNLSALVSWTAPSSDGWRTITGYTVISNPGAKTCTTTGATSCTVPGLTNGTPYTFTVKATNAKGQGAASAASAAVTPKGVPGAPGAPKAARGTTKATVSWTAAAPNGGPLTGYTVTSTPTSAGCTAGGTATSCAISGLSNGVWYTFTIKAANSLGSGPSVTTEALMPNGPIVRYGGTGTDYFTTAATVSSKSFPANCNCTVYVAYVGNFPDALGGAAAAGMVQGPVLFANTTGPLAAATIAELNRLRPARIVVLGSPGVISDPVLYSLEFYAPYVYRYYGPNRYDTAAAISRNTFKASCGCVAYIAYSMNFPDALGGAAASGRVKGPVLLVDTNGAINAATATELKRLKPTKIIVLGSTGVISATVYNSLATYAPAISRYYGANRYETATAISRNTFPASCGCTVYVAVGTDFNGALAGAAAAGRIGGPLLLVPTTTPLLSTVTTELTRLKPSQIVVIGSTTQVPDAVLNALKTYAPAN